ncbi:MAG: UDP-glucose 4-epimerase GalE [bacterium]
MSQKKNKKVLITGAGGYIGSITTYTFLKKGYEVVAVDNFSRGYREPVSFLQKKFGENKLRFYEADLNNNIDSVFEKEKDISVVVHFAAFCLVNESMEDPFRYFNNNFFGSVRLLEAIQKNGVKNIVFSSTCATYGNAEYLPINEKHPQNPSNPYGESKLLVEKAIKWLGKLQGLNYFIFRYFNVCGASDDGLIGDSKKPSALLVQNAVKGALNISEFSLTCPHVDTKDSTPIRDYVNVVDLAEAHLLAVEYLLKNEGQEIVNLGTGKGNSVLEIIKKVEKVTGHKFDIKRSEARKGEDKELVADIRKAKKILNWKPKRTIEDSILSLVKWYKKHPNGWSK